MNKKFYQMIPPTGYSPQISNLIMLLNISKEVITNAVSELSVYELDYALDRKTPTIGTLLKHIIAMEDLFRIGSLEFRYFNEDELLFWKGALPGKGKMLDRSIKGNDVSYYNKLWGTIRKKTIKEIGKQGDEWLYLIAPGNYNNYYYWFHLIEDQLGHLGQIKAIRNRIPK